MQLRSSRRGSWLALAAAGAAAIVGLWHGLELAPDAANRLRDDAFYEFTWAANVAAGRGPMVSDGVCTSGVQLLWSLCLVPVAYWFGAAALPLVAAWLGFGLHCLAALWLWRGARDRVAGLCTGLCWLGNPLLVRECQNGQETALACLLAVGLWLCRRGSASAFASLSVLAVLARTDLLGIVAGLSLVRCRVRPWRGLWVPALCLAISCGANLVLGGGLLADSALPMAWLWHHNQALGDPEGGAWLARCWWFLRPVLLGGPFVLASAMGWGLLVFAVVRPWWPASLRLVPILLVGGALLLGVGDLAVPACTAVWLALLPARHRRPIPRALLWFGLGLLAITALHWAVRWYPRDYYAAPLVAGAAAALLHVGRLRWVLAVFAIVQVLDWQRVKPEPLAGQTEMSMAGRYLDLVLPPGERVGCFNSGIVTFHAAVLAEPQRRHAILNLDGVVDARAFAALQASALDAWLDAQRVRFVVDHAVQFAVDPSLPHACGRLFGRDFDPRRDLVEVARFDVPFVDNGRPGSDSMRLYWRRGRGERPVRPAQARELGACADGARLVLWPAAAGATLHVEAADGSRSRLLCVEGETTVVVRLGKDLLGTGRLFETGSDQPVLVMPL
ncbi:MAG TPA: hypothetical protein VFT55_16860 [Planctomycetota bacterium]|nr:hypothetical protein [Planctomycetota bacterium]